MISKTTIFFLLLIFPGFSLKTTNKSTIKKSFTIYNALLYKNTPDLSSEGFHKLFLFYEEDLLANDKLLPNDLSKRKIDFDKVKAAAIKARNNPQYPVCFDIESWGLDGLNVKASIPKYLEVIKYFKKYNTTSKVGYYGVFPHDSPHKEYWFSNSIRETLIMKRWNETNDDVRAVGLAANVFYPSFYTKNSDMKTWTKIVQEKVLKIKSIRKDAKIYGFIWPQYYVDNGPFNFIEQDIWKYQLETLYKYCDGIVIWSHYLGPESKPIDFSDTMPWYKTTKEFIKAHKIR